MFAMMHPFARTRALDTLMHDALAPMLVHSTLAPTHVPTISSTEDSHLVSLVAPGLSAADVTVEVQNDRLDIHGQNKRKQVDVSIALPRDADANGTAEVADGLITVRMKRVKPTVTSVAILADAETTPVDDDAYALSVVAAGFAASDLALSIEDGVLDIRGESTRTGERLARRVRLPRDADVDKVRATHVDGILTVRTPAKAAPKAMRIAINAEGVAPTAEATAAEEKVEAMEEKEAAEQKEDAPMEEEAEEAVMV